MFKLLVACDSMAWAWVMKTSYTLITLNALLISIRGPHITLFYNGRNSNSLDLSYIIATSKCFDQIVFPVLPILLTVLFKFGSFLLRSITLYWASIAAFLRFYHAFWSQERRVILLTYLFLYHFYLPILIIIWYKLCSI